MAFDTAARIKDGADIIGTETVDGAEKGSNGGRGVAKPKIDEAALEGKKRMHVEVFAQVYLRAELAVEDAQTGTLDANRAGGSIGKAFSETLIEIVAHLRFEFEVLEGHKTKTCADTRGVGIGLSQAKIVGKNADLDVFSLLSGRERHEPAREKKKKCETLHGSRSPYRKFNC